MGLWMLRFSMMATLAIIIGLSSLAIAVLMSFAGFGIYFIAAVVVMINLAQWLFAPYIIDAVYGAREVSPEEAPQLYSVLERLSKKSGIKTPKLMVADIPIPNAFAYGSPLTGNRVAVTKGLLSTLDLDEVEAVLGHELGHLKHRDVQIMMFVSVLPAIFYYIGYSLLLSGMFGEREGRGPAMALGFAALVFYWILTMFTLYLSRLREYYADRHGAAVASGGARSLAAALAKIVSVTGRAKLMGANTSSFGHFKALFIADPDRADRDLEELGSVAIAPREEALIQEIASRRITLADRIAELFSTHPNIVKRIRALQQLS